jgi:hypothetical protein
MKPMKNQCYLVLSRQPNASGPQHWPVVACYGDPGGWDLAEAQYKELKGDKALMSWRLMEGVHLCRVDADECKFTETMNTILLPYLALPGHYRAGINPSINKAVIDFLKKD